MGNILQRKEKLEGARAALKKEFVGIDDQIDEVIELTHAWFCFPEGQQRPTVINLVGMTGVGKTSLVERLFEILELENIYYKFDIGYYANNTENLRYDLSKKVRNYTDEPVCFVLDEFQLSRSIDDEGNEIDRSNFRPIWDLLDSGKINLIEQNYGVETLRLLLMKLEHCVENGVESKGLTITKGEKFFCDFLGKDAFNEDYDYGNSKKKPVPSMIPNTYFYHIQQCVPNRFLGDGDLENYLVQLRDEDSLLDFLRETVEVGGRPKTYDFSSSIIFVIANVDEAFHSAKEMDPDMDADTLHEHSKDIGVFDIKQCLMKRFRAEQVGRLGNNYIIYPAFSSDTYRELIDLELAKKSDFVKNRFGITIDFDQSLKDIIFYEGVFPTQGTRPIFTTINYIVGCFVGRVLSRLEETSSMKKAKALHWSFSGDKNRIKVSDSKGKIFDEVSYDVKIKVESLRKPRQDDEHALTSVHEAGHAVMSVALLGLAPSKVISSSAGGAEGLNVINWKKFRNKDYALDMAAVFLAGIEAEKLIFGNDRCSSGGASSDMEMATSIIMEMVQNSGIYMPYSSHANPTFDRTDVILDQQGVTMAKSTEILRQAKDKCAKVLLKNRKALIALSLELFEHPVLDKERVMEIFAENGLYTFESEGSYADALLALAPSTAKQNVP